LHFPVSADQMVCRFSLTLEPVHFRRNIPDSLQGTRAGCIAWVWSISTPVVDPDCRATCAWRAVIHADF